ncbi:MAG: diaminopimelate epimerase [Alphaproteobacteria bacterium]|nr:diaminopimelate epimerase [Alphaproteobacteria bacterium]
MDVHFRKMHGLGNDFVILDSRKTGFVPDLAMRLHLAERRRGIGCDQLIVMLPPRTAGADAYIAIFNADGGEENTCGNATRCVGRLLFEETGKDSAVIETAAGLLPVRRVNDLVEVDLATPKTGWNEIPLAVEQDTQKVDFAMPPLTDPCCVNVGNPHAVFFVPGVDVIPLAALGPQIETHPLFPRRVNVEIAQVLGPEKIRMRVWERGVGITMACGSGACAVLVAAVRRGLIAGRGAEILLDGGSLRVEWRESDNRVLLTGGTALVCSGVIAPELLAAARRAA